MNSFPYDEIIRLLEFIEVNKIKFKYIFQIMPIIKYIVWIFFNVTGVAKLGLLPGLSFLQSIEYSPIIFSKIQIALASSPQNWQFPLTALPVLYLW